MRKLKLRESQVMSILAGARAALLVGELCRKCGIGSPTYYKWKIK